MTENGSNNKLGDLVTASSSHTASPGLAEALEAHRTNSEKLARSIKRISDLYREPLRNIAESASRFLARIDVDLVRNIAEFIGGAMIMSLAVKAQWLPHYTSPRIQWRENLSEEDVSSEYERHYRDNWPEIRQKMQSLVDSLDIDRETKVAFVESLSSHEHGFYRSTVRTVFPQIERLSRIEWFDGSLRHPLTSQKRLQDEIQRLAVDVIKPGGFAVDSFAEKLVAHIYDTSNTEEDRQRFSANRIPNRHAALHGIVDYSDFQSSINALIIADYAFQIIAAVKVSRTAAEERP